MWRCIGICCRLRDKNKKVHAENAETQRSRRSFLVGVSSLFVSNSVCQRLDAHRETYVSNLTWLFSAALRLCVTLPILDRGGVEYAAPSDISDLSFTAV
jgi:hypothetical protein